jgi:hypothetical protein
VSLMQKERVVAHVCFVEWCVISASVLWNIFFIACVHGCNLRLCFVTHLFLRLKSFHVCVGEGIACLEQFFLCDSVLSMHCGQTHCYFPVLHIKCP